MCHCVSFAEGLDVSQVPLRPRGRPPRVLSDIIAHLTQTQGHMTLPEDPIALVAGAQQLVLPPSQDCTAENMATVISQQQQQAREAAKPQQPSPQGTSTISTTTTTTTTTTTNGHHQKDLAEPKTEVNGQSPTLHTPDPHEDQNLSLSVELAAVNQAILSLTGQQPIGLKQEKAAATAVGTEDKV